MRPRFSRRKAGSSSSTLDPYSTRAAFDDSPDLALIEALGEGIDGQDARGRARRPAPRLSTSKVEDWMLPVAIGELARDDDARADGELVLEEGPVEADEDGARRSRRAPVTLRVRIRP